MITFQEHAERDCRNRCQLIDSLLRGDGKIISYEVDVSKLKKSYVGFAAKVLSIIRDGGATRNEIKDATNVEFQVIEKVVKKLKRDKTIKETPGADNRRMLQVIN
jgi:hypothetical protein|tara:strand:+ start:638 stop:952 length:315 start_codon:yes stop_codon:yes gene_type:complete